MYIIVAKDFARGFAMSAHCVLRRQQCEVPVARCWRVAQAWLCAIFVVRKLGYAQSWLRTIFVAQI